MINGWPLRVNLVITAIFSLQKLIFGVFRCGTFLHAINKPNSNVPSKLRACAHGFSTSAHRIFLLAYNRYVTNVTAHEAGQCAHSEIKLEETLPNRLIGVDLGGSPGVRPSIIRPRLCICQILPHFPPSIWVCRPKIFDKSTPVTNLAA